MNKKKHTVTSGDANPASSPRRVQRRITSISLLLSLSAGILVFGPSWRAAYSSAPNPSAARAAYGSAVPFQATGGDAVKLGQQLGTFPAGSVIPVVRCIGDFIGTGPDCPFRHLHAQSAGGITICGQGPFPDPHPEGCGYGQVVPFETDIGITVPLTTYLEHQGIEVFDYTIKCVNNGPLDVDDVAISLVVTVDGMQVFNGPIDGPGAIASGKFRFIVMHVNLDFHPDDKSHSVTAVFAAKGGVKLTCGSSGGPDVMSDPNPLNNTATVTGTIKPARKPPVYPKTFLINPPIVAPQTPGSIFLTTPLTLPSTGQFNPPLGTLITPGGTPLQPIITPLFGDGHGGFGPSTFIKPDTSPGTPIRINFGQFIPRATGDFHFDIGTLNQSPGGVSIFPSDGAGGFNVPIITPYFSFGTYEFGDLMGAYLLRAIGPSGPRQDTFAAPGDSGSLVLIDDPAKKGLGLVMARAFCSGVFQPKSPPPGWRILSTGAFVGYHVLLCSLKTVQSKLQALPGLGPITFSVDI